MIAAIRLALTASVSVALLALTAVAPRADEAESLVPARDLQADASTVKAQGLPLLLVVTRADCPYCESLKRHVLSPMLRNLSYRSKVIIRELCIDPDVRIRGFRGESVMASTLAENYEATLSPTVLLLDDQGLEIAERLVGFNSVDFYGHYLDEAIDLALETMRSNSKPR